MREPHVSELGLMELEEHTVEMEPHKHVEMEPRKHMEKDPHKQLELEPQKHVEKWSPKR